LFFEEINFLSKGRKERQPPKNKTIVSSGLISKFFFVKDSFKRKDVPHK
jgi:hypothetical protein